MPVFSLAARHVTASAAAPARVPQRSPPRPGPQLPPAPHAPAANNIVIAAAAVTSSAVSAPLPTVREAAPAAAPGPEPQPELTARRRVTNLLMEWDKFQ